jgi:glutamyl-tRNA synthetase
MTETVVRFAPSPTGLLHVGNARTAVLNYLIARKAGGKFLLRIDDTDGERSKPEYEAAIIEDLGWLGLEYDLFARQSERSEAHQAAAEKLKALGRLYPCFETQLELDRRRQRQISMGKPPVYDRASLKLSPEECAALEAKGRKPHWRFKLSQTKVSFTDLIRGPVEIDTANLSDPVLIREDGRFLYTLPSVVDDVDFHISHILRGEDHVTNTAVQIEIFAALDAPVPQFAHHPLLIGAGGEALSKRLGSLSLKLLREDGIEPMAAVSYLARTGTSDAVAPLSDMAAAVAGFALDKIGRAPAHFDPAELSKLNAKLLHGQPFACVAARLAVAGVGGGEAFWEAAKPNLTRFADVEALWRQVAGPLAPVIENRDFCTLAAGLLPPEPWDEGTWSAWTKAVSVQSGAKGRDLYHPLRLALTGQEHGPELKKLLPLIGRTKSLARLQGETA